MHFIQMCMQVFQRLQKCMISLSPNIAVTLLDRLGEGYDQTVFDWQDELTERVKEKVATTKVGQKVVLDY